MYAKEKGCKKKKMMEREIVKCAQCNIVINELLCFIQNKLAVMDEDGLIRVCVSAFSAAEIDVAKDLLFKSISTTERNISRRKNKEQKSLADIICILKQIDPDNMPIFVAKNLDKLPPVTFDHIDVTSLLKDIVLLKSAIATAKETYATIDQLSEIKTEVHNLKYASLLNTNGNVNTQRRGAYLFDSGPVGFMNFSATTDANNISTMNKSRARSLSPSRSHVTTLQGNAVALAPGAVLSPPPTATAGHNENTDVSRKLPNSVCETTEHERLVNSCFQQQQMSSTHISEEVNKANKSFTEIITQEGDWKNGNNDLNWVKVQRKRYRNKVESVRGKASILSCDKFKAADLRTALFVSNVHKDTADTDITDYIFSKTKVQIILHKIKSKQERSYHAYKVMVPRHKLDVFLDDKLWPDGITCRRFMPYKKLDERRDLST